MGAVLFIAKFLIVSGLLYGYYHFFLRNRSFHRYNHWYLLAASLLSIVVPFLSIPLHVQVADGVSAPLGDPLRVITGGVWGEAGNMQGNGTVARGWFTVGYGWWGLYFLGVLVGLVVFVRAVWYVARVRRKYGFEYVSGVRLYHTTESAAPFSFFRSIFWHQRIPLDSKAGQQIFRHELFHVRQGHSADVIWMELYCMFFGSILSVI